MKKRLISVLLMLAMTAGLGSCSADTSGASDSPAASAEASSQAAPSASEASASDDTEPEASTDAQAAADYTTELFGKAVLTINITANQEDWDYLMENATSKPYIEADIEIDGVTYEDVGIKTKGNSTLTQIASTGSDRYSLKVNFNKYVDDQSCFGLDALALNCLYSDPTYLKEYMSYALLSYIDVPASLCTFANITVNGEPYGFFLALEDVDDSFLARNFGEDYTGQAYKPESFDMGGEEGGGNFGGMNFGDMSLDITGFLTLTDESGEAVQWSDVLPEGFDTENIATITYTDGSTADYTPQVLMATDVANIASLTDANGLTASLSGYTLSRSGGPQGGGGMQPPGMGQDGGAADEASGADEAANGDADAASDSGGQPDADMDPGGMGQGGPGGGMAGGGALGVDLVYTDDELSSYSNIFDNAITDPDEEDEQRLIAALKAIGEGEDLEDYINVDEVLRYAAVNVFLVNLDSYLSNMGHNYCLYEQDGQLTMIPWDYNLSFGTHNIENASDAVNYPIDTVFSGVDAEERPIIGKLLENEEYLERYHGYLAELAEYVKSGQFKEKAEAAAKVIDSYVQNDATSFEGYDAFVTGVEALITFAGLRAESVFGQLDGTIPSTEAGQEESDALVRTESFDMSALGSMGGGGGFGGGMPARQGGNMGPGGGQSGGEGQQPGNAQSGGQGQQPGNAQSSGQSDGQ